MQRKQPFIVGNYYHIYNRGVNKGKIFFQDTDWKHFQRLLYTRNTEKRIDSTRVKGLPLHTIDRGKTIVDIVTYAQMSNHIHLMLYEKTEGGISQFMSKLSTAYSMYINKKYERTGPLTCHPFRSCHLDSDEYLRWCISYIHLNPVALYQSTNPKKFLDNFRYSSFIDYFGKNRDENLIINKQALPFDISELESLKEMREVIKKSKLF